MNLRIFDDTKVLEQITMEITQPNTCLSKYLIVYSLLWYIIL